MAQEIIVWLVFSGAIFYIGTQFIHKKNKKDCAKGCGGCSSIDYEKNGK